ncbi:MAG: pyrroline-5-carboxylate reductase [Flavicella sp.]
MKKIAVIGGGNMGFTYAASIYNSDLDAQIEIIENSQEKIEEINALQTIPASSDYSVIKSADVVFLAIKPQVAHSVFEQVKHLLNPSQLVVSIMAGITIESMQEGLGLPKVVRAMPNLPAQVKLGMTTYVADPQVSEEELEFIAAILKSTGEVVAVPSESQLDKSVGISGSGPGFVFYVMEAMEKAAQQFGFSSDEAKKLVIKTLEGSVKLYEQNDISLTEWMDRVSSKGGATIAGLNYFESKEVSKELQNGIQVCVNRAVELGAKK